MLFSILMWMKMLLKHSEMKMCECGRSLCLLLQVEPRENLF